VLFYAKRLRDVGHIALEKAANYQNRHAHSLRILRQWFEFAEPSQEASEIIQTLLLLLSPAFEVSKSLAACSRVRSFRIGLTPFPSFNRFNNT
jgi:hypothetical protein